MKVDRRHRQTEDVGRAELRSFQSLHSRLPITHRVPKSGRIGPIDPPQPSSELVDLLA